MTDWALRQDTTADVGFIAQLQNGSEQVPLVLPLTIRTDTTMNYHRSLGATRLNLILMGKLGIIGNLPDDPSGIIQHPAIEGKS